MSDFVVDSSQHYRRRPAQEQALRRDKGTQIPDGFPEQLAMLTRLINELMVLDGVINTRVHVVEQFLETQLKEIREMRLEQKGKRHVIGCLQDALTEFAATV